MCSPVLIRWRHGFSGSKLLLFCSLAISVVSPCLYGPKWLIITSALQLRGKRTEKGKWWVYPFSLRAYHRYCTPRVCSQTFSHIKLQGRLRSDVFIPGSQVPSQILLLWKKKRAGTQILESKCHLLSRSR